MVVKSNKDGKGLNDCVKNYRLVNDASVDENSCATDEWQVVLVYEIVKDVKFGRRR